MKKINKKKKKLSADDLANLADKGMDISEHFNNAGKMKPALQRVNVDFTTPMLRELDSVAMELNISRQAVIKTYLRQALDHHYLAKK